MAAALFSRALALTLSFEGGYSDHPLDPGGATNLGVTRRTLAAVLERPVTKAEVRALTRADVEPIYRARYWNAVAGDRLPAGLDMAVFDLAVNSGPGRAARLLQEVLGVGRDGLIGPVTLAAARSDPVAAIRALTLRRRSFLHRLAVWSTFGRGWSRRVAGVEAAALTVARRARPDTSSSASSAAPGSGRPDAASPPATSPKDTVMYDTKTLFTSRTVWANVVGLAALAAGLFGYDASGLDATRLSDTIGQVIAGGSFVASSIFRVLATKRIG